MKSREASLPAKAHCWSSMLRRAWKRKPSPIHIWRSTITSISFPIINKIDLPGSEVDRVKEQLNSVIGMDPDDALLISAKYGQRRGRRSGSDRQKNQAS